MSVSVLDLAQRLETDIRQRCLTPGHKYLTAQESALLLGTSVGRANRALQILAERDVVVRRRNSGTFVGDALQGPAVDDVLTVSILEPARNGLEDGFRLDLIIKGVLASMSDVRDVRLSYVPAESGVPFVQGLLEPLRNAGRLAGVIASSCHRDVYRYLGENHYPLLVMGSLYPDQPYPSIDGDERSGGKMLRALFGRARTSADCCIFPVRGVPWGQLLPGWGERSAHECKLASQCFDLENAGRGSSRDARTSD